MMRVPTETMWRLVGDAIDRAFQGDIRRQIDAMWQVMGDLSAEAVEYLDWLWGQKNIFSAQPFAPWGRFPADINLIDAESSIEGRLVGGRDGASYAFRVFSRHEPPSQGGLSLGTSSVQYAYKNTYELQSGGLLTTCTGISNPTGRARLQSWDSEKMAGHVFDEDTAIDGSARFENQGSGTITPARAGMDLIARGTDWCVLRDQYYWNGAHSWRQVWKLDIHRWPDHEYETHLGLTSFSDTGDDIELVLRTDQKSCDVTFGPVGQSVSSPKDCTHWWQQLQGASPTSPVRVELVLEYDSLKKEMSGAVWLGGERAPSDAPASVPAARRTQSIDLFSDLDEAYTTLTDLIATRGRLWQISAARGETVTLSPERGFHYGMQAPLVEADRLQSAPWNLAVSTEVISHDDQTVVVEVDDGFAQYAPEYVRTTYDGVDLEMSRTASEGARHTYTIEREEAGLGTMVGTLVLRPWYMKSEEFTFTDTGVVASDRAILPERVYFMGASGLDADLFERFGRLMGVSQRPDSDEYLNVLRGIQYGSLSSTAPNRLKNALSMALQVPYRTQIGVVGTPEPVFGSLGQIDHYNVAIGKDTVEVDPFWVNTGKLKPAGTRLGAFEPLFDLVEVHDWRSDKALLERFVDIWGVWGTALVMFDADLGLNEQRASDLELLVRKSKNRHRNYVLLGNFSPNEDLSEPVGQDRTARQTGGSLFHVRERFSFGDGVGWENNTADGDYPDTAQGSNTTMSEGSLGEGISLGDRWLDRYDPQQWPHGFELPDPTVRVLAEAVDLKRALDSRLSPADIDVGRANLRFGADVGWDPASGGYKMAGGLDPYASVGFHDLQGGYEAEGTQLITYSQGYSVGSHVSRYGRLALVGTGSGELFESTDFSSSQVGTWAKDTDYDAALINSENDINGIDIAYDGGVVAAVVDRNDNFVVKKNGSWTGYAPTLVDTNGFWDVAVIGENNILAIERDVEEIWQYDGASVTSYYSGDAKAFSFCQNVGGELWLGGDDGLQRIVDTTVAASLENINARLPNYAGEYIEDCTQDFGGRVMVVASSGKAWISADSGATFSEVDFPTLEDAGGFSWDPNSAGGFYGVAHDVYDGDSFVIIGYSQQFYDVILREVPGSAGAEWKAVDWPEDTYTGLGDISPHALIATGVDFDAENSFGSAVHLVLPEKKALGNNTSPSLVTKTTSSLTAVNAWGETASKWWAVGNGTANVLYTPRYADGLSAPTWEDRSTPGGENLLDMDNFFVVGAGGAMYHWNGASWDSIASGTTDDISFVEAPTSQDVYMLSDDGVATTLRISSDGGATWPTTVVIDAGGLPESLDIADDGTVYVVTTNDLYKYDGSTTSVSTPINPDDVQVDGDRIFIGGEGEVHYQVVGESTWTNVYDSGGTEFVGLDRGRDGELMAALVDAGEVTLVRSKNAGDDVFLVDTYGATETGGSPASSANVSYVAKTFAMVTHNNTELGLLR